MLSVDDYQYNFENVGKSPARWNCAKRKSNACPVYLITRPIEDDDENEEIVRMVGKHTHPKNTPKPVIVKVPVGISKSFPAKNDIKKEITPVAKKEITTPTAKVQEQATKETPSAGEFDYNHVYLLVTNNGRELVCVNGYMYRLEGKSKTSATFRWECIRTDVGCKTRIYTERVDDNRHKLRSNSFAIGHEEHEPYTPRHLSKLISKHKMQLVDDGSTRKWLKLEAKKPTKETPRAPVKSHASLIPDYSMISGSKSDPLSPQKDVYVSKSILGKKNFTILPSAKGNRVLCVDNMLYHYDQASPCMNRSYWTCLLRRDKRFKCKARIVMEELKDGLQIRKMSGQHNHENHTSKIDRRLASMGLNRSDIENATKSEIKGNVRMVTLKGKKVIVPNLKPKKEPVADDDCSISSASLDLSQTESLPERLELMRKHDKIITEDGLAHVERVDFSETSGGEMFVSENIEEIIEEDHVEEEATTSKRQRTLKRKHSNEDNDETEYEMDVTKVSRLRSAKGRFLLCVDDYIYYMKREQKDKNHWVCIKNRDKNVNCRSFLTTAVPKKESGDIRVIWVTHGHNHPVCERDIKRRLCNELIASGAVPRKYLQFSDYFNKPLDQVKKECAAILSKFYNKTSGKESEETIVEKAEENDIPIEESLNETDDLHEESTMKLYAVSDGPPSLAVRMTLKALNIPYELKNVDYIAAEHMSEAYAKMNPQKEIPVLDDDGFYLPESIAIMQYLCDKYAPDNEIYPKEPTERALVNHRLCFNMGFYYASISIHAMAPIFFDYPRNELTLKKVKNALSVFETYLERNGTKYAAADHVTIADYALIAATICLEGINFDLTPWPLVNNWYKTFKKEFPDLWEIANGGMQEIAAFEKNPPDLSHMNHPFHPTRKTKA